MNIYSFLHRPHLAFLVCCTLISIHPISAFPQTILPDDGVIHEAPTEAQYSQLVKSKLNRRLSQVMRRYKTMEQVKSLNLYGIGLTELPEQIFAFTNLQSLDIGGNQFEEIPKSILRFTHLKDLSLVGMTLGEIPDWMLEMDLWKAFD